jgi:hypothetical protein
VSKAGSTPRVFFAKAQRKDRKSLDLSGSTRRTKSLFLLLSFAPWRLCAFAKTPNTKGRLFLSTALAFNLENRIELPVYSQTIVLPDYFLLLTNGQPVQASP